MTNKAAELRAKDEAALKEEVKSLQKAHFALRMQKYFAIGTIFNVFGRSINTFFAVNQHIFCHDSLVVIVS